MKKKNDKNDIIIEELGGACIGVTGSCTLVGYYNEELDERRNIIFEMGLIQKEQDPYKLYIDNQKMLQGITKEMITSTDYILLSHSHVDHCGNLAHANTKNGFNGKVLSSYKTIELSKRLISDSVYIHEKNIEQIKNMGKKVKPLYTEQDMYDMFSKMEAVAVGEKIQLNKQVSIQLHTNNHSVGSVAISLWIRKPNNQVKHILYSGDMGSNHNFEYNYFTDEFGLPTKCNVFLSEATYWQDGRGFNKSIAREQREELRRYLKESVTQGKRVLICTFAYNRTQQLMQQLYEWFSEDKDFTYPIVVDGFLTNKINDCFTTILDGEDEEKWHKTMKWSKFKFNREYPSTLATLSVRQAGIYICSSGFMTAGRALTYLPIFLNSSKDCVVSIGYCGEEGSKGWAIFDSPQKTVTIGSGKEKSVVVKRADRRKFNSFSSHIQRDELFKVWANMNCEQIIVHHSECDDTFIEEAKQYLRDRNKTTHIVRTSKGAYRFVI